MPWAVAGFAHSVEATSPFIKSVEAVAVDSSNPAAVKALADQRSVNAQLGRITTPVYLFQGRVDWAFDVTQAENAYLKVKGPKHLYIGQFGHPPSTFATADVPYAIAQGIAWLDHYVRGQANGIDTTPPVAIAAATSSKRATYPGIPKTKLVGMGFRGTTANRLGPRIGEGLETFGVSLVKVQVQKVASYPRLVAVLRAGNRVISHGAIKPTKGLDTIRLANYVQYLPKGTRLTLSLGPYLNNQVFKLEGFAFALNYGLNKVRFPAPVPIPSKLRVAPKVKEVTDIQGGAQVVFEVSFEREGTEKPVCVAETVVRVYTG